MKKIIIPVFIGVLITLISTFIIELHKNDVEITLFKDIIIGLQYMLNKEIKIYTIFFVVIIFIAIFITLSFLKRKNKQNENWKNYIKDDYEEWHFTWEYVNSYDKITINNLRVICKCGCDLVKENKTIIPKESDMNYPKDWILFVQHKEILICPKCKNEYDIVDYKTINKAGIVFKNNLKSLMENI